jgi:hypothetical protein
MSPPASLLTSEPESQSLREMWLGSPFTISLLQQKHFKMPKNRVSKTRIFASSPWQNPSKNAQK